MFRVALLVAATWILVSFGLGLLWAWMPELVPVFKKRHSAPAYQSHFNAES